MKLIPHLRSAVQRWLAWRIANTLKPLRQMPVPYLMFMTATSSFVVMLGSPMLISAIPALIEKVGPTAPWYITLTLSLYLLAWGSIIGMAAVIATAHGRALGDRLFNPAPASA